MSYRGGRGKSGGGFSVTTDWDGSRTFDDSRRGGGGPRKSNSRGRGRGSYSYNKNYRGRGGGPNPRSRFEDEDGDVSMSDDRPAPSSSRYNPYGSRRPYTRGSFRSAAMDRQGSADVSQRLGVFSNSRTNTRKKSGRDYHRDNNRYEVSDSGWYRVTIPYGANVEKNELLKLMNNHVDVPFRPLQFRTEQKNATFYLNDDNSALAVKNLYKKFSLPSGFKIIVIVKPCNPPPPVMNDETKEKLKISMSERYDVAARSLNLSALYKDPKLSAEGIHVALNRYNVMTAVIKIIEQNIPELTGLDLSGNKLMALDTLGTLVDKTPHLAHLNLGNNIVKNADELAKIKNWKLTELVLEGNNLCDHYKEKSTYISAIRKHFPKVLKLDGLDLPPPITFDLELSTELPTQKDNYFKNDVVKELVVKFVKQYYDVFDSGSREALVAAYHDEAAFSMTFGYNKMIVGKQSPWPDLTTQSRNLLRVHGEEKRLGLMKRGKLDIISHFKSHFPRTTHDRNSFHVDVNIATNELLMFSVSGIFKEAGPGKSERGTIRTFQRVFSTVSHGGGVVITNDMMTVTNASPQQVQGAFKTPAPTPSSSPVLGVAPVQDPMTPDPTKLAMVQQFSVQSGMNLDWSTKCLEENEWNYEKAAKVFTEFHKEGKIPPDAFK